MNDWVDIGVIGDIPRLGARAVRAAETKIAVFRTDDDRLFALEDKCPHRSGPLSQGIVHGCRVTCPLHNLVIDLQSGEAVAPDEGRVGRFDVRLVGDRIQLDLPGARGRHLELA
ncbi:MAG: nitrite reductase small subunit NirD [Hyphomicrobiales bacterium]|nr:nitrite reductase small subunit NirD [Hyphomicrobiales bacterium]